MSISPADFNAQLLEEFRAHQGHVGGVFERTPLLLLHRPGAKSGRRRINPLGYMGDGGRYVVRASNGGAPSSPGWYHNLKSHPDVTIEVSADTIAVHASDASGDARERLWRASVQNAPQLGEYGQQVGRPIPVIILAPREGR